MKKSAQQRKDDELVQIAPLPSNIKVFARYKDEKGKLDSFLDPVLFVGVARGGYAVPLVLGSDGILENPTETSNFAELQFKSV